MPKYYFTNFPEWKAHDPEGWLRNIAVETFYSPHRGEYIVAVTFWPTGEIRQIPSPTREVADRFADYIASMLAMWVPNG